MYIYTCKLMIKHNNQRNIQTYTDKGLKSNEFAKLCNTTKRTLQYYNEIGLFTPAVFGENGYHYYSEDQCDLFMTISALSDLGMSLNDIKKYVDHKNPQRLKELLLVQKGQIRNEQERLLKIQEMIDTKIRMIDKGSELLKNEREHRSPMPMEVCREYCKEEYFVISEPLYTNDRGILRKKLSQLIQNCMLHRIPSGAPYSAVLTYKMNEDSSMKQQYETCYAYYAFQTVRNMQEWPHLIKPEGEYAVFYLRGDFHYADEAIGILLAYCRDHQLRTGEYIYKEAVLDEVSEESPDKYITKISVHLR